ncbi:hypothetical protein LTS10_007613 [Elasticomyces elasticus]|nr:hypothetical protein LTS10_007613 [Elasticomyces elasticus]
MAKQTRIRNTGRFWIDEDGQRLDSASLALQFGSAEATRKHVWSTLSTYEDSMANGLSRVSSHVSKQSLLALPEIALMLSMVGVVFTALDHLDQRRLLGGLPKIADDGEAKLLRNKLVALMQHVAESHDTGNTNKGETQDLLSLIVGYVGRKL